MNIFTSFKRILISFLAFSLVFPPCVFAQQTAMPRQDMRSTADDQGIKSLSHPSEKQEDVDKVSNARSSMATSYEAQTIKIHVLGEVSKPGIYSMQITDRVSDALALAGLKRMTQRLVEIRAEGDRPRLFDLYGYYYHGNLNSNPYLKDNDIIFVPTNKGSVRIEGPIARPGLYELWGEKNLQEIINLSGGLSSGVSYTHPLKIIRFSENGKKFIMNVNNAKRDLREFRIQKGDIVIVPDIVNNPKKFDYSVESIPGENLFYPTSTPTIFVLGQVAMAGSFPYKSHLRVKDYMAYASPTPTARLGSVQAIRNGKKFRMKVDERPIPGDILMVKTKVSTGVIITAISTGMSLILTSLLLESTLHDRL